MGLFDKETVIEKAVKEIGYTDYEYKNTLSSFNFTPYIYKFKDEELVADIIRKFARYGMDFSVHLDFVTHMFTSICLDRNNREEKELFKSILDLYMESEENQQLFLINHSFDKIFNAFDDKRIVFEYFRFLTKNENVLENTNTQNLAALIDYVGKARQYYVDDRALLSSAINLIRGFDSVLLKYGEIENVQKIIDAKLSEDRRASGIYDVDMATLAELSAKVDEIFANGNGLETLIQMSEKEREILKKELTAFKTEIKQIRISETAALQKKASQIIKDFTSSYLELMEQQRSTLVDEKDLLLQDVNGELEKKKAELLSIAENVGKRITLELGRVTNVTNESVQRLKDFVDNNEEIKQMISEAKSNDDLMTALTQVIQATNQAGIAIPITSDMVRVPKASDVFVTPGALAVQGVTVVQEPEREVTDKVNYYFDERVPFKDRYEQLIALKEKDERENGTIYHEKFNDIVKFIMLGETPYLIGPSGCGKTYTVEEQFAKLIGIKVVTDSYVTFEQAVIGYTNSGNGAYVPSNFYRCYKYGDIYFLDEIDNGIANATIILNKFMGSSKASFTFPDGITINRHPNFRIVTAGNTKGSGRTLAHNTRQKLDEATLQRMVPIEVDYDNRIEMRILKDYPAWYDFAVNFRKAVEKIPSDSGEEINTIGTFTTRDAKAIKKCLDTGVFTDEELMLYQIVQTKDEDYINQIGRNLDEQKANGEFTTPGGKQLLQLFHSVGNAKKERARVKCKTR